MSNRIIKTKASPAYVSNLEVDNLVVNQAINEDTSVIGVTEDYSITTLGPSIIAADTTSAEIDINLPPLSENIGRKLYVINIGAANNININAGGSDTIGAAAQSSITIFPSVTTTILIGTDGYWEQVATGGGGGGSTTYDVITGIYDTGWVSNNSWSNTEFVINHNFNKSLSNLIVKFYYSSDGTEANTREIVDTVVDIGNGAEAGIVAFGIDNNTFKLQTGASGFYLLLDTGLQTRIFGSTAGFYRVVVYDPQKIAAASTVEKYSTGWSSVVTDWTNAEFVVTHGLNAPADELITEFWISASSDGSNPYKVEQFEHDSNSFVAGLAIYGVSDNQLKIQTGVQGFFELSDSGTAALIDAEPRYWKCNVYKPTFLARELEVTKYDTGWIDITSNPDGVEYTINHNLGVEMEQLITQLFMEKDGEIYNMSSTNTSWDRASSADRDDGFSFVEIDDSSFKLRIASDGAITLNSSYSVSSLTGTTIRYRVVVYKPKIMEAASPVAVSAKSNDYTIASRNDSRIISVNTGGTAKTVTLPDSTISQLIPGDEFEVIKENNGNGSVTFAAQGTDTIEGLSYVTLNIQYDRAKVRYIRNGWFQLIEHKKNGFDALAAGVGTYVGMGKYDTGWINNSDWTDAEFTISHNLNKPLSNLVIKFFISTDGTDANSFEYHDARIVYDQASSSNIDAEYGYTIFTIDNNSFKIQTANEGLAYITDANANAAAIDTDNWYYRVVVYDPERISAAPSVQKYSTGWINNTDWTNADLSVIHGLDAPITDLIVKLYLSDDGTDANAFEVMLNGYNASTTNTEAYGATVYADSDNAFHIQTGANGILYVNDSAGSNIVYNTQSRYYQVVVYKPTFVSRELEVMKYDTGWVENSDWTNWTPTITHNLSAPMEELIVKIFLSSDATGAEYVREVSSLPPDSDANFGLFLHSAVGPGKSNNSFSLQSGVGGFYILDFGGNRTLIDSETWYYRVVVYKPALLEKASTVEVRAVSGDYTIQGRNDSRHISVTTAASDINIQCNISNFIVGDRIRISKADAGTGTVAFVGTNVEGYSSGIYLHSQHNYMELEWNGVDFTLNNYKDNGSNANGEWTRKADGTQTCRRRISLGTVSIASAYGNLFIDDSDSYGPYTYPIPFASGTIPVSNFTAESSGIVFWTVSGTNNVGTDTATPNVRMVKGTSGNVTNTIISYIAEGRWRP